MIPFVIPVRHRWSCSFSSKETGRIIQPSVSGLILKMFQLLQQLLDHLGLLSVQLLLGIDLALLLLDGFHQHRDHAFIGHADPHPKNRTVLYKSFWR